MPLHIAVDMDDVIVDFWGGIQNSMKVEFGVEFTTKGPWDDSFVKGFDGWGKGGFWGWMRERDWVWATFQPVEGAIGTLRQLRQAGHYLEVVTSKPDWAEPQVWRWLGKWRPPVQQVTIVDTNKGVTKAQASSAAHVLIDDKPINCQSFIDDGRHVILFGDPGVEWSLSAKQPAQIELAGDWSEVPEALSHIEWMVVKNGW